MRLAEGGPRGRPLSFQAPSSLGELRVWECKACARPGHTGPFCPHTQGKTSLLYPLPPNAPPHKAPMGNPGQETPISYSVSSTSVDSHTLRGPHPGSLVSTGGVRVMEGPESLPGVGGRGQGKGQAVGRSDVSSASVLPAPRGGDVTPYHLVGLGCLGGCPELAPRQ